DTGRRGRYLLHNMMFLDVKPENIDKIVISHGHASHIGGIEDLLRNREMPLNIYAPQSAAGSGKKFSRKGIRIPEDLSKKTDIYEVRDWMEIANKLFVSIPMDAGGGLTESFLVLLSKKGPVVISACSHAGTAEIMEAVKKRFGAYPHTFIGGVHIGKKEKEKASRIASAFSEKNCQNLYLNHCTGVNGIMYLRKELGLKGVNNFYVGSVLSVDV
ncbi:MAG: MBL fold metallo-hydrolase, partial [Methanomassiliicoccaceae archaeon]|nr:MBL fold metallo-hydrolase [Methanomassiliicoccaceae archaeon]